ncbi:MAG: hypothetical protein LBB15_01985, partial [Puniceicoccales bacterium]|nr:hypothetical protein [Puniceicoccales bacterium]
MRKLRYIVIFFAVSCFCGPLISGEVQDLMFYDESLPQVLYILEKLTGKAILCDQSVSNVKLSLQMRQNLSKRDAIRAIENVLSMNGVAIIDRGDGVLRAVNAKMAPSCATEWLEDSTLPMIASEKIYTKLFTLKHLSVADFSKIIRPMLSQIGTSVLTFEDSNCLVITDRLSNLQRVELLIRSVDKPHCSKVGSKIFRIKHADAENISSILHKLIAAGNSVEMRKIKDKPYGEEVAQGKISLSNSAVHGDDKVNAQEFRFSGGVAIEHDKYSNSIIVCGTQQDIAHVEKIVTGLDVLLDQVRIEVVIAQVTLTNNETSGLESLGISYNTPLNSISNPVPSGDKRVNFSGQGASSNEVGGGFNFGGTLRKFSLGYVFNKAKTHGNIKVLSAPTIVTTHNREASIKVGESRPVITANFTDLTNQKSIRNTVNYKDIGIELTVTPLIGPNGVIQMKIDQLVQKISGDVAIDGNRQPIITKRQAVSFVSVQDGDTVVLAGLQEKEYYDSKGKLWL